MAQSVEEWLDAQADRLLASQQARADTAKLVVTFAVGVSAALVGAASQTAGVNRALLGWTICVFAAAGVCLIAVLLLDKIEMPDDLAVLRDQSLTDPDVALAALRRAAFAAIEENEIWVKRIRVAAWCGLTLSVVTCTLSLVGVTGRA